MLVETWMAVHLQRRAEIVAPTGWFEGVSNWLLEGAWANTLTEPLLGAGGAGARLHAALKRVNPQARLTLGEGALEPFEAQGPEAPPEQLGPVPEPWGEGLVEGTAHATLRAEGLLATVTGRYVSRSRLHVPPLRLVLRGVREDLLPESGPDPGYADALAAALDRPGAGADLRDLLADAGEALGKRLAEGFADCVDRPVELRTRVWMFERTDALQDVLRGLPERAVLHLQGTARWFGQRHRPIEVIRRDRDGSVELWRGESDEVSHGR